MRYLNVLVLSIVLMVFASFTEKPKLVVTSSAFMDNQMIPLKYSCEGDDVSPPLHIDNIPSNAKSLAIIMHDPDAPMKGGFTHWVVWNIDVLADIPENFKDGQTGMNSVPMNNYRGMCPPSGTHHYHFMVYALDTKLNVNMNTDKKGLEKKMQGHVLAKGALVGLYQKANATK